MTVVEDDYISWRVIDKLSQKVNWRTLRARTGQKAIELYEKNKVDAILMDVQLPCMNGYITTRSIKETDSKIPIIGITANALLGDREKCLNAGMDDYMSKPINSELFYHIINKWIKE